MNLKSLLLVGGIMFATTVSAAIVDGRRQTPRWDVDPQPQALVTDGETEQYLYNKGAQGFALGANDWETRASLSQTKGFRWKIEEVGGGKFKLIDFVEKFSDWRCMFADNATGIWVDNNNGANADQWEFVLLEEENTFNIINMAAAEFCYLGCPWNIVAPRLNLVDLAVEPDNYVVWYSVNEEEYNRIIELRNTEAQNALKEKISIYEAAEELYAMIEEAEGMGIDVSSAKAIYLNEDATSEQIADAKAALAEAIDKYATIENPIEITSRIPGLNLDNVTGDPINTYWTRQFTGTGEVGSIRKNTWSTEGNEGGDGTGMTTPFIENWVGKGSSLSDQVCRLDTINVLPGVYRVTARVRTYNESGAEEIIGPNLFGNFTKKAIISEEYLPSEEVSTGEAGYFTYNGMLGFYAPEAETYAMVGEDGKLTFGMYVTGANYNWQAHKDYKVYYLGDSEEAYALAKAETEFVYNPISDEEILSVDLKEEFNELIEAYNEASGKENILAAAEAVEKAALDPKFEENKKAWAEYVSIGSQAKKLLEDPNYGDVAYELSYYMEYTYVDNIEALDLTTEQVKEETETLNNLYEEAKLLTPPGTDVSSMITNPDFAKGGEGWTYSGAGHGGKGVAFNAGAKCAEAWNSGNFDIHQDITNAPAGMYQIVVQGFYRYGRGQAAWLTVFEDNGERKSLDDPTMPDAIKTTPAMLYLNSNTHNLANVFDVQIPTGEIYTTTGDLAPYTDPYGEYWYANDMTAAGQAFDVGYYKVGAYGLVAKTGDPLRIGVKGNTTQLGDSWAIFTRFQLIYMGFEADLMKSELENEMAALDAKIDGKAIPSALATEIAAVKAAANAAIEAEDGKAMFEVLQSLYEVKGKVDESIAKLAELNTVLEDIDNAVNSVESAPESLVEKAMNFSDTVKAEMADYDDETIAAKIKEGKELLNLLSYDFDIVNEIKEAMPYATDEDPVDATGLLINPSFENATGVSQTINAWTQAGAINFQTQNNTAFGKDGSYYAERWHVDGTLDLYQTVPFTDLELPAGFYGITALTHCSTGDGVIYANDKETAISNTTDAAAPATDLVVVEVKEGENLTFGVKATLTADSWCCVDNFQLFYYGTTDPTAVQDVTAKVVKEDIAKAIKLYNNKLRMVVIEKNGKKYNVAGIEVK